VALNPVVTIGLSYLLLKEGHASLATPTVHVTTGKRLRT